MGDNIPEPLPDTNNPVIHDDLEKATSRDNDCYCFGKEFINVSWKTVLAFTITMIILAFSIVFMLLNRASVTIFLPIVTGILGIWVPSPVQSTMARTNAQQMNNLLQNHNKFLNILSARQPNNYMPMNAMQQPEPFRSGESLRNVNSGVYTGYSGNR